MHVCGVQWGLEHPHPQMGLRDGNGSTCFCRCGRGSFGARGAEATVDVFTRTATDPQCPPRSQWQGFLGSLKALRGTPGARGLYEASVIPALVCPGNFCSHFNG